MSRAETAFTRASCYLKEGFNCSQSILLTMQELYDMKDDLVLKAATGFGGLMLLIDELSEFFRSKPTAQALSARVLAVSKSIARKVLIDGAGRRSAAA